MSEKERTEKASQPGGCEYSVLTDAGTIVKVKLGCASPQPTSWWDQSTQWDTSSTPVPDILLTGKIYDGGSTYVGTCPVAPMVLKCTSARIMRTRCQ